MEQLGMDLCNVINCTYLVYFYEFDNANNGVTNYVTCILVLVGRQSRHKKHWHGLAGNRLGSNSRRP